MLKLYSREGSGRPPRVKWALEEAGVPYEFIQMTMEEAREGEEHRKRHPLGRVPVLEYEDGTMLFESAALLLQIADQHPEAKLTYELGSFERGLVYQWVLFAYTEVATNTAGLRRDPEGEAREKVLEGMRFTLSALDQALEGKDYLLGDFTVADVATVGILNFHKIRAELPEGKVADYVARCMERPAYKRAYGV